MPTNMFGRIPTKGETRNQEDVVEHRQRVAIYVDGNSVSYEGQITTGTVQCNFFTDSGGRRAHYGYIINDGEGDLQIQWSFDSNSFGGTHTLRPDERISLDGFTVEVVNLIYTGTPTNYRILMM